jgi:hypothetical protein
MRPSCRPVRSALAVVDALALTLVLVLLVGPYGLYRLELQQINLAVQHSNFVSASAMNSPRLRLSTRGLSEEEHSPHLSQGPATSLGCRGSGIVP